DATNLTPSLSWEAASYFCAHQRAQALLTPVPRHVRQRSPVIDWSAGNEFDQRVIRLTSTTKGGVLSCGHGVCRAASRLPLEGAKMVAPFKPSFGGSIFLIVALLAAARPDPAAASDRGAIPSQARTPCVV